MSNDNLKPFGEALFSPIAPPVWNSLHASLQNLSTVSELKIQLKTSLFRQAFR